MEYGKTSQTGQMDKDERVGLTDTAFFQDYRVDYFTVDGKRTLRPARLVDFLTSVAVKHSDALGFDLDYFAREQKCWVLLNWHIKIKRWPDEGEFLKLSTWSDQHGRVRADRDYAAEDESGVEIVNAASRWVLMDLAKRRPKKPEPDFLDPYKFPKCREISKENYKMPDIPDRPADFVMEQMVTRRDLDTNGHTNNAVYIDWAVDTVEDKFYDSHSLREIIVSYKKECMKDDTIRVETWREENTTLSRFSSADDPEVEYALVEMKWE